jgi:hypothetical protein
MADPRSVFKEAVMEYIDAHDQLAQAQGQLKDVRKKKAELASVILEFMRKNDVDECAMGDNGKLVRRESKRTEGLKNDHVVTELRRELGESRAEELLKTINAKREVIVKESLSRRKATKSGGETA